MGQQRAILKPGDQIFSPKFPPENRVTKSGKPMLRSLHSDGGGLYLVVHSTTSKSWVFRYSLGRKAHEMGLGKYPDISLADAREAAAEQRTAKAKGADPLIRREADRETQRAEDAKRITFEEAARHYISAHEAEWSNVRHAAQWTNTIADYANPVIGALPVQAIDTIQVLKVLEPIWRDKLTTAQRLRGRIEAILDWAKVRGYRTGENPARWKGHLEHSLAAKKSNGVKHLPAMPYAALPAFLAELRQRQGVSERALEFTILTAARTGETLGATWGEIDLDARMWIIPAERMKARKEHRIPLCQRAMSIVTDMQSWADGPSSFVFPGRSGRLSDDALLQTLRRTGQRDSTPHGFRSTFRVWAIEQATHHPSDAIEMALAHTVGDEVYQAYQRSDLLELRRKLAEDWCRYCSPLALPAPSSDQVASSA